MKIIFRFAMVLLLGALSLAAPSAASAASPAFVVVTWGDTLYHIAARFGTTPESIARANALPSLNFVYAGQILLVPETFTDSAAATTAHAAAPVVSVYTVRYGDTLTSIAVRYGVTIQAVLNANGLRNPNFIYSGQRLNIPAKNADGAAKTSAAAPASSATTSGTNLSLTSNLRALTPPTDGRWIDIDVGDQTITAYQGNSPLKKVLVSTGLAWYPTPIGRFKVYNKLAAQNMSGGNRASGTFYYLPNVPNVMYFTGAYAIHGTYWHRNFGTPMSRGCVNLSTEDSKWFYDFAEMGTPVVAHP